jgi:hypothetical protein
VERRLSLPRQSGPAEVPVVGRLAENRAQQGQPFDNLRRTEIEVFHDIACSLIGIPGAESVHLDGDRLCHADGIRHLYFIFETVLENLYRVSRFDRSTWR